MLLVFKFVFERKTLIFSQLGNTAESNINHLKFKEGALVFMSFIADDVVCLNRHLLYFSRCEKIKLLIELKSII